VALKQVVAELIAVENESNSVGLLSQLPSILDCYVIALERTEELLDIELPRLAATAALAATSSELPEETRTTRYTIVGQRIDATFGKMGCKPELFAHSERNALDFLTAAGECCGTEIKLPLQTAKRCSTLLSGVNVRDGIRCSRHSRSGRTVQGTQKGRRSTQ
jgi:hypothetical protein